MTIRKLLFFRVYCGPLSVEHAARQVCPVSRPPEEVKHNTDRHQAIKADWDCSVLAPLRVGISVQYQCQLERTKAEV